MLARLRIVPVAAAILTLTRIAYAQNIDLEARKQYLRGREADEMIRKGYVCYHEAGSTLGCTWAKPERATRAHWGKCKQEPGPVKGRMCERITSNSSGSYYYDFERPLVLLKEKIYEAQGYSSDNDLEEIGYELPRGLVKGRLVLVGIRQNTMARDLGIEVTRLNKIIGGWELATAKETMEITDYIRGAVFKLQVASSLEKARDIFKRLTHEQQVKAHEDFGYTIDRALLLEWATDEEREALQRHHGAGRDQTWRNIAIRIGGEQQHTWGTNPEYVCGSVVLPATQEPCPRTIIQEERVGTWREGGDPLQPDECRWINDSWQSFNLTDLRRQFAGTIENGRNTGCDSTELQALEHVAPASNPTVRKARADFEKCLESRRMVLAAKIKDKEERCSACAAKAAARAEKERQIVADNEACKADVATRKQERVEKAPTRPIAEIEAIPPVFRLPEEVQRMEDFAAEQVAKKMNGRKKPKTDR
jgi:hypothetical protein